MRFDVPDAAPTDKLNKILWHDVRGWAVAYPGVKRAAFAPLSLTSTTTIAERSDAVGGWAVHSVRGWSTDALLTARGRTVHCFGFDLSQ